MIRQGLEHLAVPCESLTLDPENVREHGKKNLGAIAESLRRFGQYRPIVVQAEGMIVRAGNGTLMAARSLGWEQIAAVVRSMPNDEATALALADNRTGDLSQWDDALLARQIEDLQGKGITPTEFDMLGWTETDLAALPRGGTFAPGGDVLPLESFTRTEAAASGGGGAGGGGGGGGTKTITLEVTEFERQAIEETIQAARIAYGLSDAKQGDVFGVIARAFVEGMGDGEAEGDGGDQRED